MEMQKTPTTTEQDVIFANEDAIIRNGENGAVSDAVINVDVPTRKHGSVLSFHDVSYTVNVKKAPCGSCRSTEPKQILRDVSGIIRPGLNALMGPTGSGKSTLLDVLAKRKDPSCVSGKVYLDGKPVPKNFQYISGYVVQSDLFVATVTVREALWFSANLRLSTKISKKDKENRIKRILNELGLESCADTKIGNALVRGISGGERKRASIATELLLEPPILFLDEPTTGLDAATAWSVMWLLKRLGNQGHTILCSIHQPRYSIYKMFDGLTLLSKGHLVYHGAANRALSYFEEIGYVCETHDNPADFYLDVLNGGHEMTDKKSSTEKSQDKITDLTFSLLDQYKKSHGKEDVDAELNKIQSYEPNDAPTHVISNKMYATGFGNQLKILLSRTGKNMIRNPQMLLGNTLVNGIIGIVFGLIYLQVPNTPDEGVQNRFGVMFFFCTNLLFGATLVIDNFIKEREIFIQEHVSGYYSVLAYFLSKVMADLIPLRTISPIIFGSITYWMVGLKATPEAFFTFLLTATLLGYAAVGIGLFYSATFSQAVGQLAMALTFIFTIIFSGLLVNLGTIGEWIFWLKYLSIARYGLIAFSTNEFRGVNFTSCSNSTDSRVVSSGSIYGSSNSGFVMVPGPDNATSCRVFRGEEFLNKTLATGVTHDSITDWDLWQNIVALACISIGLYTLTYIQLARKKMYS